MAQSEIEAVRTLLSSKPRPVGWPERRQRLDDVGSVWPVADDVSLVPIDANGVPGEYSIVPGSDPSHILMFFHGGGYCSGSIVSHRRMITEAARIAIGGDSAGAGLAIALINRLRDANEELPACAWLVSPWTDVTMSGSTFASKDAVDPIIHKEYLNELADAYLPAAMNRKDPRISPLYADLRSFPPVLIQVGSAETLLDDATRFASAAGAADVAVTLEIWPHMIHAWHLWNAHLEPGRHALANAGAFIRKNLPTH